jgi:hypothetical protein
MEESVIHGGMGATHYTAHHPRSMLAILPGRSDFIMLDDLPLLIGSTESDVLHGLYGFGWLQR